MIFCKQLLSFLLLLPLVAAAQNTVIKGKVTDATTGEAIPYVNVFFKDNHIGTNTDFDGYYTLNAATPNDSVVFVFIGYKTKVKSIEKGKAQTLNVQLEPSSFETKTVVITPGENPAFRILRGVWANDEKNNKRRLESYQYESYSKTEVDADNIDKRFTKSPAFAPFRRIFDSLKLAAGQDGKPILPIFISETISENYYMKAPERKKEIIVANKIQGVGFGDKGGSSLVSQLMGSSFQDYNFYNNWIYILEKNFVSPISTGGRDFYKYTLADSLVIDGYYCYRIDYKPKRKQDLAFTGSVWITDTTFALKQIVAEIGGEANLNYIERIKIQQDLVRTSSGHWMPAKVRILLDISELSKNSFGMLAKLYVSNKNFVVNIPKILSFYEQRIEQKEDAQKKDTAYWNANRHDNLTKEDRSTYQFIDSVKNIPRIRSIVDFIDVIANSHIRVGDNIEIGNYLYTLGFNQVEGLRFRAGFRTSYKFSNRVILKGYAAYGIKDNEFKYHALAEYFISRKYWAKTGIQYKKDVEALGLEDEYFAESNILNAFAQLGGINRLNKIEQTRLWVQTDVIKGLRVSAFFLTKHYQPVGDNFRFGYYPNPANKSIIENNFTITEFSLQAEFAYKDIYIINGNRRVRIKEERFPIFTVQYAYGVKGLLGGDFNYQKLSVNVSQLMKLGAFGRGEYSITARKVFSVLPYPMLDIQLGNETFIRSDAAFNMMRFSEFYGDQSVTAFYTQHFDGALFNRIPIVSKAKLREVAGFKAAFVNLGEHNRNIIPEHDPYGKPIPQPPHFKGELPYVEVFYGVENVFRFLRFDAIHRLTYLKPDEPLKNRFMVKVSLYFAF